MSIILPLNLVMVDIRATDLQRVTIVTNALQTIGIIPHVSITSKDDQQQNVIVSKKSLNPKTMHQTNYRTQKSTPPNRK